MCRGFGVLVGEGRVCYGLEAPYRPVEVEGVVVGGGTQVRSMFRAFDWFLGCGGNLMAFGCLIEAGIRLV